MTNRERELAAALAAIWEAASGMIADVDSGCASFVNLDDTVRAIAEDAAEALADLPVAFALNESAGG